MNCFNPLNESSLNQLNNEDVYSKLWEFGQSASVECVDNKDVVKIVKRALLNGYPNSINLIQYNLNNVDHAVIYLLNNMIRIEPYLSTPAKERMSSFKEYLLLEPSIPSIKELVKYVKDNVIDQTSVNSELYLFFGDYFLYYGLLMDDKKIIDSCYSTSSAKDLLLIYSVCKASKEYLDYYLTCENEHSTKYSIKDIEFNGKGNVEKSQYESFMMYFSGKCKLSDSEWLVIFKFIIIHQSSTRLDNLLESSTVWFKKYFDLVWSNFIVMVEHHTTNKDQNESKKKLQIMFKHFTLDQVQKSSLRSSLIEYINKECNNQSFMNNYHQLSDNILLVLSTIQDSNYLIDVASTIINHSQFFQLDLLLDYYQHLDQDLMTSVFKNKKFNNNNFYLNKTNILLNKFIIAISNNDMDSIIKIISTVNNNNNNNSSSNNNNNNNNNSSNSSSEYLQIYLNQQSLELDMNDPSSVGEQLVLLSTFKNQDSIYNKFDGLELFQVLLLTGHLNKFDIGLMIADLLSLNKYKKERIFNLISSPQFIDLIYKNNINFNLNVLESFFTGQEFYDYIKLYQLSISSLSITTTTNTKCNQYQDIQDNFNLEYDEDEYYNESSEDEDNEDHSDNENDEDTSTVYKLNELVVKDQENEITSLGHQSTYSDDSEGSIERDFLFI